jgi:hypothetical protein
MTSKILSQIIKIICTCGLLLRVSGIPRFHVTVIPWFHGKPSSYRNLIYFYTIYWINNILYGNTEDRLEVHLCNYTHLRFKFPALPHCINLGILIRMPQFLYLLTGSTCSVKRGASGIQYIECLLSTCHRVLGKK